MPPDDYRCKDFKEVRNGNTDCWLVSYQKPDTTLHHHILPALTISARAIELDMDPVHDFDDLLEIVLHEPFIDEEDPDDPAVAQGYVTTDASGSLVAASLFAAETIQDAREAHQLRVKKVREQKMNMDVTPEVKERMRNLVRNERLEVQRGRREERVELQNLHEDVNRIRQAVRGRPDGRPLKATINKKTKEAAG